MRIKGVGWGEGEEAHSYMKRVKPSRGETVEKQALRNRMVMLRMH